MKICMLLDNTFNPIDRRVYNEASFLVNYGYDVTIVCKMDHENSLKEYEVIDGIKIKRCFKYQLGTSVLVDKYLEAHFDLINNLHDKYDVYHCHDNETWPIGYILAKRDGARFICDSHEYFPDYIEKSNYMDPIKYETSKILALNRGQYLKYADGVITVGTKIASLLKEEYNLTNEPVVIYNTRYISEVSKKTSLLRDELSIPKNKRILFFHGNIEATRGIENIIDALAYIQSDVVFILAGKCNKEYAQKLHEYAVSKGVENKIYYKGFICPDRLLEYVSSVDINVYYPVVKMKNLELSAPNKFFDYIFAGTPFVIKNLPELALLTQQYDIGYLAESVKQMAIHVDELLKNADEYAKKAKNMRNAQQSLCWESQGRKLLDFYQRMK